MAALALSASAVVAPSGAPVAEAVAARLSADGWHVVPLADPADPAAAAAAVAEAEAAAPLELVLVAPPLDDEVAFDALSPERWAGVLQANLGAARTASKAALPALIAGGGGNVLLVTSSLAQIGGIGVAHVASAQGAVHGLVRGLAKEVAPRGVHVNAIAASAGDDAPAQVASLAAFLVSESHFITGQVLAPSDGAVL